MKILIALDKFKGSLTAMEVCRAVKEGLSQADSSLDLEICPMADGGDGSLAVLKSYVELEERCCEVYDPLMRSINATYFYKEDIAFIEMASASGLVLLTESERNCMNTSSYGTGQLILDAISNGAKEIYLFVGGSATNDAGMGMANALGYTFIDKEKNILSPIGKHMIDVEFIDNLGCIIDDDCVINIVCDVTNPMLGPEGATYSYARQKGASLSELALLEQGMQHFTDLFENKSVVSIERSGAAGGIAGGAVAFLGANLLSGIEYFMDITDLALKMDEVQLVITGEGSIDDTSIHGKTISGVCKLAKEKNITVLGVCGVLNEEKTKSLGMKQVFSLIDISNSKEDAMLNAFDYLVEISKKQLYHSI